MGLDIRYRPFAGWFHGLTDWGFSLGAHVPRREEGWMWWSWLAVLLYREPPGGYDRALVVTIAGRTWTLHWNWSPWCWPEDEWAWRQAYRLKRLTKFYSRIKRYDR